LRWFLLRLLRDDDRLLLRLGGGVAWAFGWGFIVVADRRDLAVRLRRALWW